MNSKFKVKTYYEIEYNDFDKFIKETFGKAYECVADNEWSNYSSYDFDVKKERKDPESYFQQYTLPDVEAWISGTKISIGAGDLLEYLVYKDILPEGSYLITVFW